ncbi:uncharacterized protein LOC135169591 [Diachasmimorpha longicaudata]|uniref:uncharacterized protein LOC135169591 n=1 Tax=Diachasmimorpha longicaudata TaxID=58733 RepID=UPI0030B90999
MSDLSTPSCSNSLCSSRRDSSRFQSLFGFRTSDVFRLFAEHFSIHYKISASEIVTCKNGTFKAVCTFFVHNNDGEVVQCVMWGDTIDEFLDKLFIQHVAYIDRAFPKQVSGRFNSGTTPFELVIQSNTVINDLGKLKTLPPSQSNIAPEVVPLIGLSKYKKIVAVKGFVKTPWTVIAKQTDSTNTCFGSIAADKFFMDVKISEYPLDYVCEFSKGQHVQCVGSVIRTFSSFFFCVQGPVCITLVDDQVASLKDLLVCKPLIVARDKTDAAGPSKKLKRNELRKKFLKKD